MHFENQELNKAQHKSLDMGIAIGTSWRQQHRFNLSVGLKEVTERRELRVSVDQNVRMIFQESVVQIGEVACQLTYSCAVWRSSNFRDFNPASLQIHHNENERRDETAKCPDFRGCI